MKTICASGYKTSSADQKAIRHYILKTDVQMANDALKGMLNKAKKTILRDWLDKYRALHPEGISSDEATLITAIVAMPGFTPYNRQTPAMPIIERKVAADTEIWPGGFSIQDWEEVALRAYYENPESMMYYFIEEQLRVYRKDICKEATNYFMKNKAEHPTIPSAQDDIITTYTALPSYLNRTAREA